MPGKRNAVLFGAFHCTEEAGGLYEETRRRLPPGLLPGLQSPLPRLR